MLADLDLLLTAVFAAADDLLPERRENARRSVTDAEVVTLAVAQAIMDISSDREFLAVAAKRLAHLFRRLPLQPGYWKRRRRCSEHIDWLIAMIESIFWTLKDRLGLERHHARTMHGLRARIAAKLLALAAGVWLNHYLGRPTRAFADLAV